MVSGRRKNLVGCIIALSYKFHFLSILASLLLSRFERMLKTKQIAEEVLKEALDQSNISHGTKICII